MKRASDEAASSAEAPTPFGEPKWCDRSRGPRVHSPRPGWPRCRPHLNRPGAACVEPLTWRVWNLPAIEARGPSSATRPLERHIVIVNGDEGRDAVKGVLAAGAGPERPRTFGAEKPQTGGALHDGFRPKQDGGYGCLDETGSNVRSVCGWPHGWRAPWHRRAHLQIKR